MRNFFDGKRAALIDMDGVLYDSMPGHTLAWKRMMDGIGINCSRSEFYLYEGMTGAETINLLFRRGFGHDCDPDRIRELYALKSKYFKESGPRLPMPSADRMLAALGGASLTRVLVTGSAQVSLLDSLNRDYPGVFAPDCRITANDVVNGKPAPEPYLRGAERAGVSPSECIVVENAPLGVRAGKAAGCFTVAVTTGPIPREAFEREGADLIFPSMPAFAEFLELELARLRASHNDISPYAPLLSSSLLESLRSEVAALAPDRVFILTDTNVRNLNLFEIPDGWAVRTVAPGESGKSLAVTAELWQWLAEEGASRRSLLINLGGGVVSDLGGFVAATFKRGIRFINVPTTLLAAADAAIGGKTGIDFLGLKNEIGVFAMPERVIIAPEVFKSLPDRELRSGLAEIVKMAMVGDAELYAELLDCDALSDPELMSRALMHAARLKAEVVRIDPREKGLRRILNFGHTAGHAYESYAARIGCPVSHGEAVAHGILHTLRQSEKNGFPHDETEKYEQRILHRYYSPLPFGEEAATEITALMTHDKKNADGKIRYVLLDAPGCPAFPASTDPSPKTC